MKSWYSITNKSDTEAEVCLYDEIGMWGISAKDFLNELKSVGSRKIKLRINSPGGEVFDGLAIFNRLKEHKGGVEVHIDGIAASMASVIAMCGEPVKMAENALFMIHNPNGICMGDAEDMRDLADMLDKVRGCLTGAYEKKTGKTNAEILAMMDAETWLDAKEAMAMGFVDEITDAKKMAASVGKLKVFGKLAAREKEVDARGKADRTPHMQSEDTTQTETVATVITETPETETATATVVEAPVAEAVVAVIDVQKIAASAVSAERERATSIRAWAAIVEKLHNLKLDDAVTAHINDGSSLAAFKEFVITNKFTPKSLITQTDHAGSAGNTMTRDAFAKMSPFNQSDFCRKGGKITD